LETQDATGHICINLDIWGMRV